MLYIGDSPTLETGFPGVGKNLLRRWQGHFERVDIWGIGFSSYPGRAVHATKWNRKPFVLYPASYDAQQPWYDVERFQELLNHIMGGDCTNLFMVQDYFLLATANLSALFPTASLWTGASTWPRSNERGNGQFAWPTGTD